MRKAWNYSGFKKRLKDYNPEFYENYKKQCGFQTNLRSEGFYEVFIFPLKMPKYVRFKEPPFVFPGSIDFSLLFKFTAASFSSEYEIKYPSFKHAVNQEDLLPELYITAESDGKSVTKPVHLLWEFQLIRLFDIYCSELMALYLLYKDAEIPNSVSNGQTKRKTIFEKKINEYSNKMERSKLLFDLKK